MQPNCIAPPPWQLKGSGFVFLYRFPKTFIEEFGFLAPYQQDLNKGDFFGTVMLIDYQSSNVGSYFELLFIPGRLKFGDKKLFSISKIYVSSFDSVYNGINNWGIPKELADFTIIQIDKNQKEISVKLNEKTFFKARLKTQKLSVPISTKLFPLKLAQKHKDDLYITSLEAKGTVSLAKIADIEIDTSHFPDISTLKPLSFAVKNFEMKFLEPKILHDFFQ